MEDKILSARKKWQATEDKMAMLRNMANLCADIEDRADILADYGEKDEALAREYECAIDALADIVVDDWKRLFPEYPIERDDVLCGFKKIQIAALSFEALLRILQKELADV